MNKDLIKRLRWQQKNGVQAHSPEANYAEAADALEQSDKDIAELVSMFEEYMNKAFKFAELKATPKDGDAMDKLEAIVRITLSKHNTCNHHRLTQD